MSYWTILESFLSRHVLPEERMYRGETSVRMKDLRSLFNTLSEPDKKTNKPRSSDPKVQGDPDPNGGFVLCSYPVDPRVWGRWNPQLNAATVLAGTDKKDTQHVGAPKGSMVFKQNYGGRVITTPGNPGKDFDQLGSAMDRYDVLMVADVTGGIIEPGAAVNWPPGQKDGMPSIVVRKIAWSPSIGTADERMQRISAILSGQQVQSLKRRPQPELPVPDKDMNKDLPPPVDLKPRR